MAARTKTQERIYTVGFMFLVTLVCISILAAIAVSTSDRVKRNQTLFFRRAVLEAAGIQVPRQPDEIVRLYEKRVSAVPAESNAVYYAILEEAGSAPVGYAFPIRGSGLWGPISGVLGLGGDLAALTGVTFTEQGETPGLGARIEEPWFKAQFKGKTGPFHMVPEGTGSKSPQEFDAITGATITSSAVRDMVNRALSGAKDKVAAVKTSPRGGTEGR